MRITKKKQDTMINTKEELSRQLSDCLLGLESGTMLHDVNECVYSYAELRLLEYPANILIIKLSDEGVTVVKENVKDNTVSKVYDCLHSFLLQTSPMYSERYFQAVSAKLLSKRESFDNNEDIE